MRKILKSDFGPAVAVVLDLLVAYLFFILARVAFLVENRTLFADTLADGNLARIFRGGLLFDTSAIFYINALWLVLMLFPLWLKEARLWHKVQRWIFVVTNGLAFAINLADSVYYPFTMRRTTTSVFREFDNENNLGGIFLSAVLDHWVLVLLGVAAFFALYYLYVSPRTDYRDFLTGRQRLRFAGVNFVALALAAVGSVRICARDRRREPLRGNRAVSYFAAARARRAQPIRNAVALRRDRHGARPLPPRRGARAPARYRRAPPAADGRRRLGRRL